jgi:hypothetical protein
VARPGTFPKGVSGNASGRPKVDKTISDLAAKEAPEAFMELVRLCKDPDPKIRLQAVNAVLDRACGKPKQSIDAVVEDKTDFVARLPMIFAGTEEWLKANKK